MSQNLYDPVLFKQSSLSISAASMTCFSYNTFLFKVPYICQILNWYGPLPEILSVSAASMTCFPKHFSCSKVPQMCQIIYDPVHFKKSFQCREYDMFFYHNFLFKGVANVSNLYWSSTHLKLFTYFPVHQVWHVFQPHFSHSKVPQMCHISYHMIRFTKSVVTISLLYSIIHALLCEFSFSLAKFISCTLLSTLVRIFFQIISS
jgi:hypothetical protein